MSTVITVYDLDREALGVVDEFVSLVWTERYAEPGEFELQVELSQANLEMLLPNYYISIPESETWMIIETRKLVTSVEDGNKLIISGRSLLALYERRQLPDNSAFGGGGVPPIYYRADVVMGVVNSWAFGTGIADRQVSYIITEYSDDVRITDTSYSQVELSVEYRTGRSSENALDKLRTITSLWGVGFKMVPDEDMNFVLTTYLGKNRTRSQSVNDIVEFSPAYDNLEESEYIESVRPERSFIYAWGPPQPPAVIIRTAETAAAPTGILMREGHYDASHINPYQSDGFTPKTLTDRYADIEQEAEIALTQMGMFSLLNGKIINQTFYFGEHYDLGDVVQFGNGFGGWGNAQVTEMTWTFDDTGSLMYPTLEFFEN